MKILPSTAAELLEHKDDKAMKEEAEINHLEDAGHLYECCTSDDPELTDCGDEDGMEEVIGKF